MPKDQLRSRTVGCKMTDAECERLIALAETEGLTLSEWCRRVLLARADREKLRTVEEIVLAEVLALRTILLNAFYQLARGEVPTPGEMQNLIERADLDKLSKAQERFVAAAGGAA
ncbi:MAG TPA: hypothetical protein VGR55_10790 [Candidatus Acidoferrum sp.]|nr:hypothetical protein [Candidatus Acidoferrum sp.]